MADSISYNFFVYGTMSVNNDGYNDFLCFDLTGLSQNVITDSAFNRKRFL